MYAYGHCTMGFRPTTLLRKAGCWVTAWLVYVLQWPFLSIHAAVGRPLLPRDAPGGRGTLGDGRLPLVIMSHGAWSMRGTYSALCCDLASHGFVVAALEHCDGSGCAARYTGGDGRARWKLHEPMSVPFGEVPSEFREQQLHQRVAEVRAALDALQGLDEGRFPEAANVAPGGARLALSQWRGRLDLSHVAIAGHSFGGAAAVAAAGADLRLKCSVAMDCWWRPLSEEGYVRGAGGTPLLCINTEGFGWESLARQRERFFAAREALEANGQLPITSLKVIKGARHQDQSDFPLLLSWVLKKLGMAGKINPKLAKDINSRLCLDFLLTHLMPAGRGFPYELKPDPADMEHIISGTSSGRY